MVRWYKTQKNGKWGGTLQVNWSLSIGNKGFFVYLVGNTDALEDDNSKITFDGMAHTFENQSNSGGWKTTGKIEIKNRELKGSEVKEKFPEMGDGFDEKKSYNKYWNFLDENGRLDHKNASTQSHEGGIWHWTGNGSGNKEIKDWSSNLDKWWKHLFDGGTNWDMAKLVGGIRGSWKMGNNPSSGASTTRVVAASVITTG